MKEKLTSTAEIMYTTQKKVGILFIIGIIIALIQNFLILISNNYLLQSKEDSIFNIITLFIIGFFVIFSIIYNHKFFRLLQLLLLIICSMLGLFLNTVGDSTWSMFLILTILIAFLYGYFDRNLIIKTMIIIIFIAFALVIRIMIINQPIIALFRSIANSAISGFSILFVLILFKEQIQNYQIKVNEYKILFDDNLVNIQLGTNYAGLAHNLNFSRGTRLLTSLIKYISRMKIPLNYRKDLINHIQSIINYYKSKEEIRDKILEATDQLKFTTRMLTDINETLKALYEIMRLDLKLMETIKFELLLDSNSLFINCIPFELFLIFDNIIQNSINALLNSEQNKKIITIQSKDFGNYAVINIQDNGPGFDKKLQNDDFSIKINELQKDIKNKGINYILDKIESNNGLAKFYNNTEGGGEVIITFMFTNKMEDKHEKE